MTNQKILSYPSNEEEEDHFLYNAGRFIKRLFNKACNQFYNLYCLVYNKPEPGGEEFRYKFEKKYGKIRKLKFMNDVYEKAISRASTLKRPLLLFIHDTKENCEEFIKRTICNIEIIERIVINMHLI